MIFEVEEKIDAPVGEVWRHLSDPASMGTWMPGIVDMRAQDDGPLAAGSRLLFTSRGAERSSDVVAFEPERLMALRSTQGAFTATYTYGLRPAGAGTIVSLQADCVVKGVARIMAPLIRPMIRRADQGQLMLLKEAVMRSRT